MVNSFHDYLPLLQHKHNFWTVFKIRSQLPFSALRQNDVVFHTLQSTNGRLSVYPWEPSVTNVFSLGFFIGALQMYQTEVHFTEQVKNQIALKTKTPVKHLHLQCVRSRISIPHQGVNIQCEAFDLQIRREDFGKLFDPICRTFPGDAPLKLMLYKDRYDQPAQFAKAIHLQAQFQLGHKIIAINGISSHAMFSFEPALRITYPDIVGVLKTNTTDSKNPANQPIGRWNILCSNASFPDLALQLYKNLPKLFAKFLLDENRVPSDGAEPVCVVSNFKGKPRTSGDFDAQSIDVSRASYQSGWTVGLAQTNVEAEIPQELLRYYAPESDRLTIAPSTATNPKFKLPQSHTYAHIVSAGVPASNVATLSPPAATTPPHCATTTSPNEHLFHQMCEQIQALSAKIEGLETAFAATRNTQHQSPASDIQKQQHHASEPEPAPNLTQLTEVLSTLVTKFEVLQHDMTTLKGQLQEGASKSKSSPSRKKSKNIDNQKPAVTPQDEGPYPSLHNAVHLPSIRPDGTPDEGEMQDEDVDHDSL